MIKALKLFFAVIALFCMEGYASVIGVQQDTLSLYTYYEFLETEFSSPQSYSQNYSGYLFENSVSINSIDSEYFVETMFGDAHSIEAIASAAYLGGALSLVADAEVYFTGNFDASGTIYDVLDVTARSTLEWVFTVSQGNTLFGYNSMETDEGYFSLIDLTLGSLVLEAFGSELSGVDALLLDGHQYALYADALDTTFNDGLFEMYMDFGGASVVKVPEPKGIAFLGIIIYCLFLFDFSLVQHVRFTGSRLFLRRKRQEYTPIVG